MKKSLIVIFTFAVFTGTAAAQQKISVSLDAAPLIKSTVWWDSNVDNSLIALVPAFEYLIIPGFTIGAGMDMYFGNAFGTGFFYFGFAAHGRGYPLSAGQDRFFLDVGLGFNMFAYNGALDPEKGGFFGSTLSLAIGYRLMVTANLFFEPSMAYVYAKIPAMASIPTPLGWQPGLRIGMVF